MNNYLIKLVVLFVSGIFFCNGCVNRKIESVKNVEELIGEIISKKSSDIDTYTFIQNTIRYDKTGDVRDTSIWYEAVKYPDKFRIDFGDLDNGRTALFRNDSSYRFNNFKLDTVFYSPQDFLFFESGFEGYHSVSNVLDRLTELGYDPNEFHYLEDSGVYVIGGNPYDMSQKQVWFDKANYYMVKSIVKLNDGRVLEVRYNDFKKIENFWIETKVTIFLEGKLYQIEFYKDIDTSVDIPNEFFSPKYLFDSHWIND